MSRSMLHNIRNEQNIFGTFFILYRNKRIFTILRYPLPVTGVLARDKSFTLHLWNSEVFKIDWICFTFLLTEMHFESPFKRKMFLSSVCFIAEQILRWILKFSEKSFFLFLYFSSTAIEIMQNKLYIPVFAKNIFCINFFFII